jgi:hypothetical protein
VIEKGGPMSQFEMIYYKKVQNGSAILAEFGVKIVKWGLSLYKLKMIQGESGGTFIVGPAEKYVDKATGQEKFSKYWMFDKEIDDRFQKELKRFIEEYIASQSTVETDRTLPKDDECPF